MTRRRSETERLMMRKRLWLPGLVAVAAILAPQVAQAQIVRVNSSSDRNQAIGFNLGYFALRGEASRVSGDVLFTDLDSLAFDIKDFNGASVGAEWLIGMGDFLEAGFGANFYQRTVPSVYRDVVNNNGSEIEQDLKLRVVPLTATVRFLPIGRKGVTPYVGAGVGVFNWRYSETGEFVDFSDNSIFRASYKANGNAVGPGDPRRRARAGRLYDDRGRRDPLPESRRRHEERGNRPAERQDRPGRLDDERHAALQVLTAPRRLSVRDRARRLRLPRPA